MPDHILNAPSILLGGTLYYDAFWCLTSCRVQGNGVLGEIPWTAIRSYADEYEFTGEQRETLFFVVQGLDSHYVKKLAKG